MNHQDIKLENVSKLFEYERICRDIDSMNEEDVRHYCKLAVKLYYKQQETLSMVGKI